MLTLKRICNLLVLLCFVVPSKGVSSNVLVIEHVVYSITPNPRKTKSAKKGLRKRRRIKRKRIIKLKKRNIEGLFKIRRTKSLIRKRKKKAKKRKKIRLKAQKAKIKARNKKSL